MAESGVSSVAVARSRRVGEYSTYAGAGGEPVEVIAEIRRALGAFPACATERRHVAFSRGATRAT